MEVRFDQNFIDHVVAIQWFQHCGDPIAEIGGMEVSFISSWAESLMLWNSDQLNTLHGEQRSHLQLHLFNHYRKHHALWNEMAALVKKRLDSTDFRKKMDVLFDYRFNELHIDFIVSQIRLAVMEANYAFMGCQVPNFFRSFLRVYSLGHLPCGWDGGEFPKGRLIVF